MSFFCEGTNSTEQKEKVIAILEKLDTFMYYFDTFHANTYYFLCFFGVLANILIIVVLLRPTMRKSPFNLFLIIIAVCDASLLVTYWIYKLLSDYCNPIFFYRSTAYYTVFYAMASLFLHSASLWLTVNMAILRYLVLYRGAKSTSRLPQVNGFPAAIVGIVIAIIIAFIGSFPNMLYYRMHGPFLRNAPSAEQCVDYAEHWKQVQQVWYIDIGPPSFWSCAMEKLKFWMAAIILKIIPCILLTVFMTLLIRMLMEARERRARICGGAKSGNSQAEKTTAMLVSIVAVFLVTELPHGLLHLFVGMNMSYQELASKLRSFTDFLSLLNSAINFILCALMSHLFRREFINTFGMCCPKTTQTTTGTTTMATKTHERNSLFPVKMSFSRQQGSGTKNGLSGKDRNGFLPLPTDCPDDKTIIE